MFGSLLVVRKHGQPQDEWLDGRSPESFDLGNTSDWTVLDLGIVETCPIKSANKAWISVEKQLTSICAHTLS